MIGFALFCSSSSSIDPIEANKKKEHFETLSTFFFEFKKRPDAPPSFLRHSFVPLSRRREKHARRERERVREEERKGKGEKRGRKSARAFNSFRFFFLEKSSVNRR